MSRFQLVFQNPTIDELCFQFPHLCRFFVQGYECDRKNHRDNEVGLFHEVSGRSLRVSLADGNVSAIA